MSLIRAAPLLPMAAVLRRTRLQPPAFVATPLSSRTPSSASQPGRERLTPQNDQAQADEASWPMSTPQRSLRLHAADSTRARRRVTFATPSKNSYYEVTPYEERYGMHPSCFDFDAEGNMVTESPTEEGFPALGVQSPCCGTAAQCSDAVSVGAEGVQEKTAALGAVFTCHQATPTAHVARISGSDASAPDDASDGMSALSFAMTPSASVSRSGRGAEAQVAASAAQDSKL
mmetsp:Transcript_16625/g.48205  ORF Transcript_16625/g.48205 Transcript_16625/m.48205 type:complete len:231 (+) Transcript_16625:41-733(+)